MVSVSKEMETQLETCEQKDDEKVRAASICLEGKAHQWFQW